jgi:hypothetical protein
MWGFYNDEGIAYVEGATCESCNSHPCDWTAYGPEIISHLNENYVGFYIDNDGNVQDELTDSTSIITNHHSLFSLLCILSCQAWISWGEEAYSTSALCSDGY